MCGRITPAYATVEGQPYILVHASIACVMTGGLNGAMGCDWESGISVV